MGLQTNKGQGIVITGINKTREYECINSQAGECTRAFSLLYESYRVLVAVVVVVVVVVVHIC